MHLSFKRLECDLPSKGFPVGTIEEDGRHGLIAFRDGILDDHGLVGGLVRVSGSVLITYGSSEILKVVEEGVFENERVRDPETIEGWPRNHLDKYTPTYSTWRPVTVITHASKIGAIEEAEKTEVDE
jgi:hypothetical protein